MTYLVIFHTFSGVMSLEKELKKRGIHHESMPAPRQLSTDCGVAIKFSTDNINTFLSSVAKDNIHRVFLIKGKEYELVYENF